MTKTFDEIKNEIEILSQKRNELQVKVEEFDNKIQALEEESKALML